MMIDFASDGEPETLFQTDSHQQGPQRFDIPGGSVEAWQCGQDEAMQLGTGALLWSSSPALAQALGRAYSGGSLAGFRVIELGCGCAAQPSVVAAVLGAAAVATDMQQLMPALHANFERYAESAVGVGISAALRANLEARPLDWTSKVQRAQLAAAEGHQLVLCADCVDESEALLGELVETICAALASAGTVVIASGARSQRLLAVFLAALRRHLRVTALSDALTPLSDAEAERASQRDGTRFFGATWLSADVACSVRAAHSRSLG